ncbi:sigma-54 dependent transcriptional regulator [Shewanella sp. A32]|uniref:sigma-54 interaction domain-containing protein n=1 Tax=Shewanella sp. A32 TaxID=3031327 RepID=UPI0023BA237E|nr:sigma-54 dependent transcriptional regulator [Shewanella sp. A32]MDF0534287.1 sigma-54 dependent transcriptional regulator [Shewanella sp. A32]
MDQTDKHLPATDNVEKRYFLLLDPEGCLQQCRQKLQNTAWRCVPVDNAAQALQAIHKYNIQVAVATINTSNQHFLANEIDTIHQQFPCIYWLGISDTPLNKDNSWLLSANFVDYYHLPVDWCRVINAIGHAWGMAQLCPTIPALSSKNPVIPDIQGDHPILQALRRNLQKFGAADETVLLSGETGSGKGLCAKWLHQLSKRSDGPFISVNCGALPSGIIHSTLFGHEKGAFTGADKRYIGQIEQANGGTLFLDEIADLPLDLQVHLLHFLDDHTIMRIGSNTPLKVDCRLLFASHQDLESAVDEGRFREDLFHRLNVLRLHVPSLREYRSDIMLLAQQLLDDCLGADKNMVFSDDAVKAICSYSWPGNVRELRNRIHRAVVLTDNKIIQAQALGLSANTIVESCEALNLQRAKLDADLLLKAVTENNNNISAAARQLNISRTTFYRLIKKCNIQL